MIRVVLAAMAALWIAGCVPLLDEDGRSCPCAEGYRCVNGVCMDLPPPSCGDGVLEPAAGEMCEEGVETPLGEATCVDCAIVCNEGYADCDAFPGCEQTIEHPSSCGSCFRHCLGDENTCRNGRCIVEVAVEPDGVAAISTDFVVDRIYWLTRGTYSGGQHANDAALKFWSTKVMDFIDSVSLEDDLAEPAGLLELAGQNADASVMWTAKVHGEIEIHRRSIDPNGFDAEPFEGPFEAVTAMVGSSSRLLWMGADVRGGTGIYSRLVDPADLAQVVPATSLGDNLTSSEDDFYWRAPTGIVRMPKTGGAAQAVLTPAPALLVGNSPNFYIFVSPEGSIQQLDATTGETAVLASTSNVTHLTWVPYGLLWVESEPVSRLMFQRFSTTQQEVLAHVNDVRFLVGNTDGVAWVEGDSPAVIYFLRRAEFAPW